MSRVVADKQAALQHIDDLRVLFQTLRRLVGPANADVSLDRLDKLERYVKERP